MMRERIWLPLRLSDTAFVVPDEKAGRFAAYYAARHLPGGADLRHMSRSLFSETTYTGVGFGLGFAVTMQPERTLLAASAGDYFWVGMASTSFWIDPLECVDPGDSSLGSHYPIIDGPTMPAVIGASTVAALRVRAPAYLWLTRLRKGGNSKRQSGSRAARAWQRPAASYSRRRSRSSAR